jgi:hypothetical protein
MAPLNTISAALALQGFDTLEDVGPAAFRAASDPLDAGDGISIYEFCVFVSEHAGAWTVGEPNASWIQFRSPDHLVEFIVRLREIRREERARPDADPETSSRQLTEADVQRRPFPCERCKKPFRFRALPPGVRSSLMNLNLRLPSDRRKPNAIRAIRELLRATGCSAVDAKGMYDHLSVLVGRHPLEREQHCHQCDTVLQGGAFQDCTQCGALNIGLQQ